VYILGVAIIFIFYSFDQLIEICTCDCSVDAIVFVAVD